MDHDVNLGARPINGWWCQVLKGPLPILREVERLAGVRFGFGRSNGVRIPSKLSSLYDTSMYRSTYWLESRALRLVPYQVTVTDVASRFYRLQLLDNHLTTASSTSLASIQ